MATAKTPCPESGQGKYCRASPYCRSLRLYPSKHSLPGTPACRFARSRAPNIAGPALKRFALLLCSPLPTARSAIHPNIAGPALNRLRETDRRPVECTRPSVTHCRSRHSLAPRLLLRRVFPQPVALRPLSPQQAQLAGDPSLPVRPIQGSPAIHPRRNSPFLLILQGPR